MTKISAPSIDDEGDCRYLPKEILQAVRERAPLSLSLTSIPACCMLGFPFPCAQRHTTGSHRRMNEGAYAHGHLHRYTNLRALLTRQKFEHIAKADIFSLGAAVYEAATLAELPKNGPEWHRVRTPCLPHPSCVTATRVRVSATRRASIA